MNEAVFNGLIYLLIIVLTVITILVLSKRTTIMDKICKIFGIHHFRNKDMEYFKSKASYKYLKFINNISFYSWLFFTICSFYMFLYTLNYQFIIASIMFLVITPLIYRVEISIQMHIHKKK